MTDQHEHAWDPRVGVCECGFSDGGDPNDGRYDAATKRWIFADGWSAIPPHRNPPPNGEDQT